MLYELRMYSVVPGKVGELLTLVENEGLPIIKEYSKLVGWWSTKVGPLNHVVHLWEYQDAGHREKVRAAQNADPRLAAYRTKVLALIVNQTNMLLSPARFSPLK
jgi:hypothetical protein